MKFFRKYALVLPPAALLYGIFAWNMKYPGDGLPQTMMDNLVNVLLELLFIPAQAQPPILMVVLLSSLITQ